MFKKPNNTGKHSLYTFVCFSVPRISEQRADFCCINMEADGRKQQMFHKSSYDYHWANSHETFAGSTTL